MIENDEAFDALASIQRRRLLLSLLEDDSESIPELSDESQELLTAHEAVIREFLSSSVEVANTDKDSLRLHHIHLPMLAEYGFIKWDREINYVTEGPQFDDMKPLLEVLDKHQEESRVKDPVVPLRR